MHFPRRLCIGVFLLVAPGFAAAQSAEKAWKKAFNQCGRTDLASKRLVFFGTSNTVGVGSVWAKKDDGYSLRFDLPKLVPDEKIRTSLVNAGQPPSECTGDHTGGTSLAATLPFLQTFASLTGASLNWSSGKNTVVTVDKIAFDQLSEVDYENLLNELSKNDPTNIYYRDTTKQGRLVMNKAYRVSGLTLTTKYTADQLKDLKTKYPEGGSVNVGGDKGGTITFSMTNTGTLTLKASKDIYIAGAFAKLEGGSVGLAGVGKNTKLRLTPVDASEIKIVAPDPVQP